MADTTNNALNQASQLSEDSSKDLYLTFHVNGEDYGLDIGHVIEIVGVQNITEVPNLPVYVKGVVNMRGLVIPVMDIRLRFGMTERPSDERTCLIFVCIENDTVGLLVDRVNDVTEIPVAMIEPAPKTGGGQACYIKGMGKSGGKVNILLDTKELLTFGRITAESEFVGG